MFFVLLSAVKFFLFCRVVVVCGQVFFVSSGWWSWPSFVFCFVKLLSAAKFFSFVRLVELAKFCFLFCQFGVGGGQIFFFRQVGGVGQVLFFVLSIRRWRRPNFFSFVKLVELDKFCFLFRKVVVQVVGRRQQGVVCHKMTTTGANQKKWFSTSSLRVFVRF